MMTSIKNIQREHTEQLQTYKTMQDRKTYTPNILLYCEGSTDKVFVNTLKVAFGNDKRFSVMGGDGGSPEDIIYKCIKIVGAFEKYCIVDSKPKITKEVLKMAEYNNITIITVSPFLECVVLNFLEDTDTYSSGYEKNNAKETISNLKSKGSYSTFKELLDSKNITKTDINNKKSKLGEFVKIVDLFEKYKDDSKVSIRV